MNAYPALITRAQRITTARRGGDRVHARQLRQQLRATSSKDPADPGYRKLRYIRYTDDQLLGFTGPTAEAEEITNRLVGFLREELARELSAEKTLITHARTRAARFLGYDIITQTGAPLTHGRRAPNAMVGLRVPQGVVKANVF